MVPNWRLLVAMDFCSQASKALRNAWSSRRPTKSPRAGNLPKNPGCAGEAAAVWVALMMSSTN